MREFSSTHRRLGKKVLRCRRRPRASMGASCCGRSPTASGAGERIGVIGPDGSGKTTFLRRRRRDGPVFSGSVTKGETTVFGHLHQAGGEDHRGITVIDFMRELAERVPQERGESMPVELFLERFLFPRSMHAITLDRLSGGELRRLTLIRLLATAPNFLLLDEPTNDLDLDTIRLLEEYLADFGGCILLVSHDRAMLDRLTDSLLYSTAMEGPAGSSATTRSTALPHAAGPMPPRMRSRMSTARPTSRRRDSRSRSAASTRVSWPGSRAWKRSRSPWSIPSRSRPHPWRCGTGTPAATRS